MSTEAFASLPYTNAVRLGGGAYAEVFRADGAAGRVAVKVARRGVQSDVDVTGGVFFARGMAFATGSADRLDFDPNEVVAAEARVLAAIDHPAFPRLRGEGEVPATRVRYFAADYIEGLTWRRLIHAPEPGDAPLGLAEVRELLGALQAVQDALPLHGDIKPDNLLRDAAGRVRIIDPSAGMTSLSPAAAPGRLLLTSWYNPGYAVSDVPALGLLLAEVLTGQQLIVAASNPRPARPVSEALRARLEGAVLTGRGDLVRRLPRMPLPTELCPAMPAGLEAAILRTLGLAWDGAQLDAVAPFAGVAELDAALAQFSGWQPAR